MAFSVENSFYNCNGDSIGSVHSEGNDEILCWQTEAAAIIQDVQDHVNLIDISNHLNNQSSCIYLNVRTLEGDTYCIEASNQGFCILSRTFDVIDKNYIDKWNDDDVETGDSDVDDENGINIRHKYYETIYSLLDRISPLYVRSFGSTLCAKLHLL